MAKKSTRILLWVFLGTSFLLIGGACFYLYHHSPFESTLAVCPMYRFFHLYCPGCGLTRAFYLLLHGHPLLALRQNPVALPLLLFVLYLLLAEIVSYLFPRPILPRTTPKPIPSTTPTRTAIDGWVAAGRRGVVDSAACSNDAPDREANPPRAGRWSCPRTGSATR